MVPALPYQAEWELPKAPLSGPLTHAGKPAILSA
jgi:hypothetical protein